MLFLIASVFRPHSPLQRFRHYFPRYPISVLRTRRVIGRASLPIIIVGASIRIGVVVAPIRIRVVVRIAVCSSRTVVAGAVMIPLFKIKRIVLG